MKTNMQLFDIDVPKKEKRSKTKYGFSINFESMMIREATGPQVQVSQDVANLFPDIGNMAQEAFFVVTMNSQHRIIDKRMISLGTVNASLVHPREVYRPAIADSAQSVIFAHNHPSGDTTPSEDDKALTKRLVKAGKIIGIKVLDHVIIGKNGDYFSFADNFLLD